MIERSKTFEPVFFGPEALGNGMNLPTASETLQLCVRNTSAAPASFLGHLYGQGLR
jgi:hypothetical protein